MLTFFSLKWIIGIRLNKKYSMLKTIENSLIVNLPFIDIRKYLNNKYKRILRKVSRAGDKILLMKTSSNKISRNCNLYK
jgi:hypothetical protein